MTMSRLFVISCVLLTFSRLLAAEPGTITSAPGYEPHPAGEPGQHRVPMPPMTQARSAMMFEVESVTLVPGDVNALSRWTELAAQGYHVVASSPGSAGGTTLYLERLHAGPGPVQIPAGVAQDAAAAATTRAHIAAAQADRQSAVTPQSAPVPAPAPAAK